MAAGGLGRLEPSRFDFFAQQEHARRDTRRLVLWYLLAVTAVVTSYCAAGALAYAFLGM